MNNAFQRDACRKSGAKPSRRGLITILTVVCLVLVMGFLAFSLDWGYMSVTHCELQKAADAAALAGARGLDTSAQAAVDAATTWAGKNTAAGSAVTNPLVELGTWDDTTAMFTPLYTGKGAVDPSLVATAVRVTCGRTAADGNALTLFFAPLLGTGSADVVASAVAARTNIDCGYIIGRTQVTVNNGQIDSYNSSRGTYGQQTPGQRGDVCSDGNIILQNNSYIYGNANPGPGGYVSNPSLVTGNTDPRTTRLKWSSVALNGVNASSNNSNSLINARHWDKGVLSPNGELLLTTGTYYLAKGMSFSTRGSIRTQGQVKIVMDGASMISGKGIVNDTSVPGNLRIELVAGSSFTFAGQSQFYADIYGPEATITIDGNAGFYGAVFAKTLTLSSNNANIHGDEALISYKSLGSRVTLVQ
ncbi:MAG: hypothetical protein RIS70_3567 [Planctomycetota bacterium]